MAIDFREIALTDEQKRIIARLAEETGRSWQEVIDEQFDPRNNIETVGQTAVDADQYIENGEKWLSYFENWLAERKTYNPHFDDSRESIYPDRA